MFTGNVTEDWNAPNPRWQSTAASPASHSVCPGAPSAGPLPAEFPQLNVTAENPSCELPAEANNDSHRALSRNAHHFYKRSSRTEIQTGFALGLSRYISLRKKTVCSYFLLQVPIFQHILCKLLMTLSIEQEEITPYYKHLTIIHIHSSCRSLMKWFNLNNTRKIQIEENKNP